MIKSEDTSPNSTGPCARVGVSRVFRNPNTVRGAAVIEKGLNTTEFESNAGLLAVLGPNRRKQSRDRPIHEALCPVCRYPQLHSGLYNAPGLAPLWSLRPLECRAMLGTTRRSVVFPIRGRYAGASRSHSVWRRREVCAELPPALTHPTQPLP